MVSSLAVYFDLTVRKIPNWLIVSGLLAAVSVNALQGMGQLSLSVLGFLAGIAALIAPFALGWLGAGDVKYFALMGAFCGITRLPLVAFYSVLAAGAIALGYVLIYRFDFKVLKRMWTDLRLMITSFGHVLPDAIGTRTDNGGHSVPWGVAIAAGTIIAYYLDPRGQWVGF